MPYHLKVVKTSRSIATVQGARPPKEVWEQGGAHLRETKQAPMLVSP